MNIYKYICNEYIIMYIMYMNIYMKKYKTLNKSKLVAIC